MYAGNGTMKLNGGASHHGDDLFAERCGEPQRRRRFLWLGRWLHDRGQRQAARIHYDRRLSGEFFVVGNAMMSSFSWKKY